MCANKTDTAAFCQPHWRSSYTSTHPDLYFRDGKRRIDFVLVYSHLDTSYENALKREAFLSGLAHEMVEIEVEDCNGRILGYTSAIPSTPLREAPIQPATSPQVHADAPVRTRLRGLAHQNSCRGPPSAMDRYRIQARKNEDGLQEMDDLIFVKLYAPWHLMSIYGEKFNFRKQLNVASAVAAHKRRQCVCSPCCKVDKEIFEPLKTTLTWPFNRQREFLYDIPENKDEFFTPVERHLVLDYILRRARYFTKPKRPAVERTADATTEQTQCDSGEDSDVENNPVIGITKLLKEGVFLAAYPLHEPSKPTSDGYEWNNRTLLIHHWASFRSICKPQPLDYIRYYFGEATAFYFAWLGFYTTCLVPVALLGLLVFLSGLLSIRNDPIQKDVCNHGSEILMCPLCSYERCKFWRLNASCVRTKLTRLVDNEGTVLFGVIMALWAIIFLELWKRQQVSLAYRWNVFSLEPIDQPARPEFLSLLDKGFPRKVNPISENEEPLVPFWRRRVPCLVFSYTTVLFAVVLTLACLVGVILYKLVIKVMLYQKPNPVLQSTAGLITTVTGSVMNLILIYILQFVYNRVAVKLTDLEDHRTQMEYDNGLTLKLYLLQFVNFYSSIFYIAFIQGTTAALPGSRHSIVQSTGCDEGDCLFELFIQLTIIMVGKQILGFIQETMLPVLLRLLNSIRRRSRRSKMAGLVATNADHSPHSPQTAEEGVGRRSHLLTCRWDFGLLDPGTRLLFGEYLEMMIQFGFITMFVPAFPLAPLFGLLNNLFEIRGDAKKLVHQYRRPVVDRAKAIGIWYPILLVLSNIAIRTNACVIAFTTQFIDRWVYQSHYSLDGTTKGFKNFTLSFMPTSRFQQPTNETYCRYDDYRSPPWEDPEFSLTLVYYHVLAAKFIFVFLFETIAILLTSLIASMIPDVPKYIKTRIYREVNQTSKVIVQAELINRKTSGHVVSDGVKKDALSRLHQAATEDMPSGLMPIEFFPVYPFTQLDTSGVRNEYTGATVVDTQTSHEEMPLIGFDAIY